LILFAMNLLRESNGYSDDTRDVSCLYLHLGDDDGATIITSALLDREIAQLQNASRARIIVIEGEAGSFCQGLDTSMVSYLRDDLAQKRQLQLTLEKYAHLLYLLDHCGCPIIAVVDGAALGGGLGFVAVADLVLASPRASFGLPETLWGLVPGVVFPYLARRVGPAKARLLACGVQPLRAERAFHVGLVDEVTDNLDDVLQRYVRRLVHMDAHAVGIMKSLTESHVGIPDDYFGEAILHFMECVTREETQIRLARFASGLTPWTEEQSV
jgi:enoyl-CoA hydratase/carnithine racemase